MRRLLTDLKTTIQDRSCDTIQQTRRTLHDINAYLQVVDEQKVSVQKPSDGKASR